MVDEDGGSVDPARRGLQARRSRRVWPRRRGRREKSAVPVPKRYRSPRPDRRCAARAGPPGERSRRRRAWCRSCSHSCLSRRVRGFWWPNGPAWAQSKLWLRSEWRQGGEALPHGPPADGKPPRADRRCHADATTGTVEREAAEAMLGRRRAGTGPPSAPTRPTIRRASSPVCGR